jgi:pyruvate,water dikinase
LNLKDPQDPSFSLKGCQTIHDVIRFAHEMVLKEMFGLSEETTDSVTSVRLITDIPLALHLIDLGGGLKAGLTTRDKVTPDHLESIPLKALWKGFCHPGITWKGNIPLSGDNLMRVMVQGVLTGPSNLPGGDSYAILSREYLNLSAKFGYHYAHLDAFLSDIPEQNYISLQFAGGIGPYYGKSLRLNFVGNVLFMLGFKIQVTGGDFLEASLTGYDIKSMNNTLDQVGRLLASSRLLDMAIATEAEVKRRLRNSSRGNTIFSIKPRRAALTAFILMKEIGSASPIMACCKTARNMGTASLQVWPMSCAR